MNILILGSGGREHALAWKIAQSDTVSRVWVAPGNAGTATEKKVQNVEISATNIEKLIAFATAQKIDLTIVGPEGALAAGIADHFNKAGLAIFAPSKAAAQLETSKDFSKAFMQQHHIPTAQYKSFEEIDSALTYLEDHSLPVVIKADGLAAGKGVIIAKTHEEAKQAVTDMLGDKKFGDAGNRIIIEAFVQGTELSYIVMVDGNHVLPLASSKDHKHRDNGDKGPNTGGMGAVSPSPLLTPELEQKILNDVIYPTVAGMNAAGTPYVGFLYAGLMISNDLKTLNVLEFNCRLGDPETQAILPRLQSDLSKLCQLGTQGKLNTATAQWSTEAAITVVMAAGGYPTAYHVGDLIKGINSKFDTHTKIFQAGTKISSKGLVTNGGRVLCVTSLGKTLQLAYDNAYNAVEKVTWNNCYYRTDIGLSCMAQPTSA